jgi:hypothetical protein
MWFTILNKRTLVHNHNLVKIKDGIQSVRDCDDSMAGEFLAKEALYDGVGGGVEADEKLVWKQQESN